MSYEIFSVNFALFFAVEGYSQERFEAIDALAFNAQNLLEVANRKVARLEQDRDRQNKEIRDLEIEQDQLN